ncbi:MAG: hypothetical protein Q8L29_01955 [archaeon]|nr:hypothetical protein [archaeon]
MKVIVKAKFNAARQNIEKVGDNKYLIYLPFEEDGDAMGMIKAVLSKYMGVPVPRIECFGKDIYKDWVFEVR